MTSAPAPLRIIGNPADRRVQGFRAAAEDHGYVVRTTAWRDAAGLACADADADADGIAGAGLGPDGASTGGLVRIDSVGDDRVLDAAFRGDPDPAEPGEIRSSSRWYRGFVAALAHVSAGTAGSTMLNDPDEVALAFDKRRCATHLHRLGIPVAPASPAEPSGFEAVVDAARAAGWRRVFVKPRFGSSGAGVAALVLHGHRVEAVSNIEVDPAGRLFASTRSRRTTGHSEVGALIDALCADEAIRVERWFPKAGTGGATFDLRVLVVAGAPRHVVVRTARGPITNLNLGNGRGDLGAVRAAMGPYWDAAMTTCARVGAAFPRSLHVGVDLLIGAGLTHHVVGEVNAFGDLLPGIVDRGSSTFEAEVAAIDAFVSIRAAA